MAVNPLTDDECEAISLLQAGNPEAFQMMLKYFWRMYQKEMTSCVDCNMDNVEIHRGQARALGTVTDIHVDATNRLNS